MDKAIIELHRELRSTYIRYVQARLHVLKENGHYFPFDDEDFRYYVNAKDAYEITIWEQGFGQSPLGRASGQTMQSWTITVVQNMLMESAFVFFGGHEGYNIKIPNTRFREDVDRKNIIAANVYRRNYERQVD
jgi:hypothetical protein